MAKTRLEVPDPMFHPAVTCYHVLPEESGLPFSFHAVALASDGYFKFWDTLTLVPWPPDDWVDWPEPTEEQLLMVKLLVAYPYLICDLCPYCNSREGVPGMIRWNLERGHQYQYGYPACPYNGSWDPVEWSPDQWPPLFWWDS
jgi:hypothetical protein